ncbi:MAG: hypothetical protein AB7P03_02780 [Kofleriaceae bacterium]
MRYAIAAVWILGCSNKPDPRAECERAIAKAQTVLDSLAKASGSEATQLSAKHREGFIQRCEQGIKRGKPDPITACVLAARDDAALRKCFDEPVSRLDAARFEATNHLRIIGKILKAHASHGGFLTGSAGPTPPAPCCSQPDQQCIAKAEDWSGVWNDLEFEADSPFRFQYSYTSDGKTFTATAVGDPECNGKVMTFQTTGKIENGVATITAPAQVSTAP